MNERDHQVALALSLVHSLEKRNLRHFSKAERALLRTLNAFIKERVPS